MEGELLTPGLPQSGTRFGVRHGRDTGDETNIVEVTHEFIGAGRGSADDRGLFDDDRVIRNAQPCGFCPEQSLVVHAIDRHVPIMPTFTER
jgi:hypothetical protein